MVDFVISKNLKFPRKSNKKALEKKQYRLGEIMLSTVTAVITIIMRMIYSTLT